MLGARPPDTSLSLPTSPDKQPPWPRAFPLPPVEEKQWHQPGSMQTNVVPINVSGRAAPRGAVGGHGCSHLGQGVGGGRGLWLRAGSLCLGGHWGREGTAGPSFPAVSCAICSFVPLVCWPCSWQVSQPCWNAQPRLFSPGLSPHAVHPACLTFLPSVRLLILVGPHLPPAWSCPVLADTGATLWPRSEPGAGDWVGRPF